MYPYSTKRAYGGAQRAHRRRQRLKFKLNDRIKQNSPGTEKTAPGRSFLIHLSNTDNLILLQGPAADDNITMLLSPIWQQKGGDTMTDILISFLVSVLASVAGYYICKWLDSDDSDSN